MNELERKIDDFLKINDRLPVWVKIVIYYISAVAAMLIGRGERIEKINKS